MKPDKMAFGHQKTPTLVVAILIKARERGTKKELGHTSETNGQWC